MWKCHKCGKPVYFAERKQSLGYDWHPECLRCEECGKRLNPGQHAEHKGVPYCHVPCYGALFGPQLFGHGTRVESHKSYGVKGTHRSCISSGPPLPRDHLESKLKVYNQFYDNKSMEVRSREVNNRLILEGALRVYWGVQAVIHLKEDDDQRTFVVRKRNSCRISKAADEVNSDKDGSESYDAPTATSEQVEPISTDISLSESMTFDSCSLNEYSELPSTPEDPSLNTTGSNVTLANGQNESPTIEEGAVSTNTLCDAQNSADSASTSCVSSTLPSNLDKLEQLNWDEIDDLLQVERRHSDRDKVYETMPVRLPSASPQASSTPSSPSERTPTKTVSAQNSTDATNLSAASVSASSVSTNTRNSQNNSSSSSPTTKSPTSSVCSDKFLTATSSLVDNSQQMNAASSTLTSVGKYESFDDVTLKPMDFEDFKRSVHQEYVSGANSLPEPNDDTLKRNQPIDPSRIHDSLKLYGACEKPMSKSFNCEHALRSIDAAFLNDTLSLKNEGSGSGSGSGCPYRRTSYGLQKSGSTQMRSFANGHLEKGKGINRSKSGPSCFDYLDSDEDEDGDSTLRAEQGDDGNGSDGSSTIRRSDVPAPRYVQIEMDCYPKEWGSDAVNSSACDSIDGNALSNTFNSGDVASDELTQTEGLLAATADVDGDGDGDAGATNTTLNDYGEQHQPLHMTEDGVVLRRPPRTGAAAIKRRSGNRRSRTKLKRRCSINGHFYNRETSFFTPPYGSQMSVWVTSLVNTQEVINLVLEKYKVDSPAENFSLFIIRDNGEQKRLKDTDFPLLTRIMLGPHEDVARLFLVDARKTDEISNEVAQFINLSLPECRAILERYDQELEREIAKIKDRYSELRRRIVARMESLKVHL